MTIRGPKIDPMEDTPAFEQRPRKARSAPQGTVAPKPRASRAASPSAAAVTRTRAKPAGSPTASRHVAISTPLLDDPDLTALFQETLADAQLEAMPAGDVAEARPDQKAPRQYPPTNAFAIVSMILGIVWLGGLGSLLAVIFGAMAKKQIKQRDEGGRGMANAGIILGITGLFLVIALFIMVPFLGDAARKLSL